MSDFSYIYKTKFRKMGKWNLLPLDSNANWHSEETSHYFKKIFGFGKGTFIIQTLDDDMQHAYFPQFYIDKVYKFIADTNKKDYKKFSKIIKGFYQLRSQLIETVVESDKINFKKLSNAQLIKVFLQNRDWSHRVTPYDQFGWIAEDYWTPIMENILLKHGIKKDSVEYFRALFILTKPEKISTTLMEKREVIRAAIAIKQNKKRINSAAAQLASQYGWMPVFTFGTPWDQSHYMFELKDLSKKSLKILQHEYLQLKNYRLIRNRELKEVVNKYQLQPEELQQFIDFGLALDARNEAEYLVSLCGFYVLPIYNEIARRLFISVKQLRNLLKAEVVACLRSQADAGRLFAAKGKIIGWVFDKHMLKMKILGSKEAQKFFNYLNKTAKNLQGNDEVRGICASPGKVSGRAKIIHYPDEGHKVKEGDILITHATTVDYLPPMKRAAAYVTEVGGLTCHAAVVAREFGVPCVVGLKNVTKNFKDGDLVEVDADKGTVRRVDR